MFKKVGKLIHKDVQRGTSKAGKNWTKMTFVIDCTTDIKYPKRVAFDTFKGDVIEFIEDTSIGTDLSVDFDVESREWEGRWFPNINAIRAEIVRIDNPVVHAGTDQMAQIHGEQYQRATDVSVSEGQDDLPFNNGK